METTRTPVAAALPVPRIRRYQDWLQARHGLAFEDYDALWHWSTTELDAFWHSIWEYFAIQSPTPPEAALQRNVMPGARWFPGTQVNYARQVLRHVEAAHAAGQPALIARSVATDDDSSSTLVAAVLGTRDRLVTADPFTSPLRAEAERLRDDTRAAASFLIGRLRILGVQTQQ